MHLSMNKVKETIVSNLSNQDRVGKTILCWKRGGISDSRPTALMSGDCCHSHYKKWWTSGRISSFVICNKTMTNLM